MIDGALRNVKRIQNCPVICVIISHRPDKTWRSYTSTRNADLKFNVAAGIGLVNTGQESASSRENAFDISPEEEPLKNASSTLSESPMAHAT